MTVYCIDYTAIIDVFHTNITHLLHILCENKNDFYHQQPTVPILVNPVGPASELKLQKLLDYPLRKLSLLALNALLWSFNHDLQIVLKTRWSFSNYKVASYE